MKNLNISVRYNFFESSHGKSASDGLGAVVKHSVTMAVTRRETIVRNGRELFDYCRDNLETISHKNCDGSTRKFFYVETDDIVHKECNKYLKTVVGTMSIHCVKPDVQQHCIATRELSCACKYCIHKVGEFCTNQNVVGCWSTSKMMTPEQWENFHPSVLPPQNTNETHVLEEDNLNIQALEVENNPGVESTSVEDGSFVLIRPAEKGYDYYLIRCQGKFVSVKTLKYII